MLDTSFTTTPRPRAIMPGSAARIRSCTEATFSSSSPRMRISPLLLMLALMVFGALWGFIGLLLAVPLLVCVKLVLARIEGLEGWARLLE